MRLMLPFLLAIARQRAIPAPAIALAGLVALLVHRPPYTRYGAQYQYYNNYFLPHTMTSAKSVPFGRDTLYSRLPT